VVSILEWGDAPCEEHVKLFRERHRVPVVLLKQAHRRYVSIAGNRIEELGAFSKIIEA
jgi:hypothetical protein